MVVVVWSWPCRSFNLDMNRGLLTLNFSEPMIMTSRPGSVDVRGINLHVSRDPSVRLSGLTAPCVLLRHALVCGEWALAPIPVLVASSPYLVVALGLSPPPSCPLQSTPIVSESRAYSLTGASSISNRSPRGLSNVIYLYLTTDDLNMLKARRRHHPSHHGHCGSPTELSSIVGPAGSPTVYCVFACLCLLDCCRCVLLRCLASAGRTWCGQTATGWTTRCG